MLHGAYLSKTRFSTSFRMTVREEITRNEELSITVFVILSGAKNLSLLKRETLRFTHGDIMKSERNSKRCSSESFAFAIPPPSVIPPLIVILNEVKNLLVPLMAGLGQSRRISEIQDRSGRSEASLYSYHSTLKSFHSGLSDSINAIFLLLNHPFICFSRVMADLISGVIS